MKAKTACGLLVGLLLLAVAVACVELQPRTATCDCGEENQDDDDDAGNGSTINCRDLYTFLYNDCGYILSDETAQDLSLEEVIWFCTSNDPLYDHNSEIAGCLSDHYGQCRAAYSCLCTFMDC